MILIFIINYRVSKDTRYDCTERLKKKEGGGGIKAFYFI